MKEFVCKETGAADANIEITKDPSIIGGFIFEVADKRIDASISRQLEELRREFIEKNGRVV